MFWQLPPKFKIYEALGALADNRIEIVQKDSLFEDGVIEARQYSSTRNKFYTINYNPDTQEIMTNDNATWFVGYLGYPALSVLLFLEKISFDRSIIPFFKDIPFKDINQKHKNDLGKSKLEIDDILKSRGLDFELFEKESESIYLQLQNMNLKPLGEKVPPPKGY